MAKKAIKKKVTKKRVAKNTINIQANLDDCCGSTDNKCGCGSNKCGCSGCAYFLGFIGAAIYYITTTEGFWVGVWGVIKAAVWPAFLVFKLLGM